MGFQTCRNLSVLLLAGVALVGCNNTPKTASGPMPSQNVVTQGPNPQLQNQDKAFPTVKAQSPLSPAGGLQPTDPYARTTVPPSPGFTPGLPTGPSNLAPLPNAPLPGTGPSGIPMPGSPLPGSSMPVSPLSGAPFPGSTPLPGAPIGSTPISPPTSDFGAFPGGSPSIPAPDRFPPNRN